MSLYEHILIARQDITQGQAEAIAELAKTVLEEKGGKVAKQEYWGLKTLAYRMKKNRKGHMMLLNIDAPSEAVQEMERRLRLHEDVLRYLTVAVEELEEGPSVMMRQGKDDRPSRDSRDFRDSRDDRSTSRRPYSKPREQAETQETATAE